ncbi:DUF2130 domain-containing protein [Candidatus Roizmanbacteria bacterium]|nr:DUF2130 domain-containing protein [Candidatus Roizmanbacteria bacterium]
MNDQIVCPNCGKPIPLTQALSHEIKEKLQKEKTIELAEEKKRLNEEAAIWRKEQITKIEDKVKRESEYNLKNAKEETEDLKKQNKNLQEQLLELNRLMRQIRTEREQEKINLEKKLVNEQDKIRAEEKKRSEEEFRLKILEKDKKLGDALKMVDEYKRKLEQGSQQLQGEIMELEIEKILKNTFPQDEVKEVPKGITGADVIHIVKNNSGRPCGTIIWELKRTKAWSDGWLVKLKEDQRRIKAEIAVIISEVLPENIKTFGLKDSVWIGNFNSVVGLASALRKNLIDLELVRLSTVGKKEKMEILWQYLNGTEFIQRVEAIVEAFTSLQEDVEQEKRWFVKKWSKQEKNIRKVIDNTFGMHGDLQSIVGKALPEIKGIEALPEGSVSDQDDLFKDEKK